MYKLSIINSVENENIKEYEYKTHTKEYDIYNRNTLYSKSINFEDEDKNEDIYSIILSYDNSVIEPVIQLPLSPNQHMLMKKKWNTQLDIDLMKSFIKQISNWTRCSSNSIITKSHVSEFSEKSTKSFFNKFSKKLKSKKHQIKFYDNLIKK
jgi:hypothetical protein